MSKRSEVTGILYKYFKARIGMEKELNSIKSQLCQCSSFNAISLFNTLDTQNKGKITLHDILNFLSDLSFNASIHEVEGVIHYFTPEISINLSAFIQGLIPREVESSSKGMSTPNQCLIQLIFAIVDHNEESKKLSQMTEQIDENLFVQSLGMKKDFTPQDLIRLFAEFNDELDGMSFEVIFKNTKFIPMSSLRQMFNWKSTNRRQERMSECLLQRKKSIQRKVSFQSALLSDISTEENPSEILSNQILFCKEVDIDPFDREVYLYN